MKHIRIFWFMTFMSLFLFIACEKDDDDRDFVPKYLVDNSEFTPVMPATVENIKSILNQFGVNALGEHVKYDVTIHRIVYKTLFEGDSILVSGVVATPIPVGKKEVFPILSYQHGTIFRKNEAPSVNTNNEFMLYLASTGMVVVIADYIGFGASSAHFHPYMHKEYTVNAVLDMIRATKELIKVKKPCQINDQLFLFGYSQGGGATVAALEAIETKTTNSDLKVTAASAGSGAYDLTAFRDWVMKQQRYEKPSYIAYVLKSFSEYAGVDADYSLVFNDRYAQLIPGMFDGLKTDDQINAEFGTEYVAGLFFPAFHNNETFNNNADYQTLRQAFASNKVSAWSTSTPLKLFYGSTDVWVPGEQTMELLKDFRLKGVGANITMTPLTGMNHLTAFPPTLYDTMDWFLSLKSNK